MRRWKEALLIESGPYQTWHFLSDCRSTVPILSLVQSAGSPSFIFNKQYAYFCLRQPATDKVQHQQYSATASMSRTSHFRVYDIRRQNTRTLPSPPEKIHQYRFSKEEWANVSADVPATNTRAARAAVESGEATSARNKATRRLKNGKTASTRVPKSAVDVLRCDPADACWRCHRTGDADGCGNVCYQVFRRECSVVAAQIDIKGPAPGIGYGVYAQPNVTFAEGQILDEYLGELRPMSSRGRVQNHRSRYVFEFPRFFIDAHLAGNWTRFVNSHCRPNVSAVTTSVGQRTLILFQAKSAIRAGEEMTICYGRGYFESLGINCTCSAYDQPHLPTQM